MSEQFVYCFSCSHKNFYQDRLSFREECDNCKKDLHICKNCVFYDEKAYNECRESSADKVQDKEKQNVCEYFKPQIHALTKNQPSREELLKKAESLFKKKGDP